jgi:hypothetical protein
MAQLANRTRSKYFTSGIAPQLQSEEKYYSLRQQNRLFAVAENLLSGEHHARTSRTKTSLEIF